MEIFINGDREVDVELKEMPPRMQRGMVRSMNRAITSARAFMAREVSRDTGLRSRDVRDAMPLRQATVANPVARFAASLRRIPLIKFSARGPEPSRGKGRGVSYRLPGGRGRIANAFIATMSSGHRGVFTRRDTRRLPIRELMGPSLGHVFAKFRPQAVERMSESFDTNLAHEFKWAASGAADPGGSDAGTD